MRSHIIILLLMCVACRQNTTPIEDSLPVKDDAVYAGFADTTYFVARQDSAAASRDSTLPAKIVAFAKQQLGVRYQYCSMDPKGGFDCSGFVYYVFTHFDIKVPRSSVEFTNEGDVVSIEHARPADLILFTGTDPKKRVVGHIGIVISNNNGDLNFIHSSSGKEYAVIITPLNEYYMSRFVKIIRIL